MHGWIVSAFKNGRKIESVTDKIADDYHLDTA